MSSLVPPATDLRRSISRRKLRAKLGFSGPGRLLGRGRCWTGNPPPGCGLDCRRELGVYILIGQSFCAQGAQVHTPGTILCCRSLCPGATLRSNDWSIPCHFPAQPGSSLRPTL